MDPRFVLFGQAGREGRGPLANPARASGTATKRARTEAGAAMTELPKLVPLVELAQNLCVSPHTVRSWVRKGRLRSVPICRRLLFHPDEIARFVAGAK